MTKLKRARAATPLKCAARGALHLSALLHSLRPAQMLGDIVDNNIHACLSCPLFPSVSPAK